MTFIGECCSFCSLCICIALATRWLYIFFPLSIYLSIYLSFKNSRSLTKQSSEPFRVFRRANYNDLIGLFHSTFTLHPLHSSLHTSPLNSSLHPSIPSTHSFASQYFHPSIHSTLSTSFFATFSCHTSEGAHEEKMKDIKHK